MIPFVGEMDKSEKIVGKIAHIYDIIHIDT